MQFQPEIHTKSYLQANLSVLTDLIQNNFEELKKHAILNDVNLLSTRIYNESLSTVAHHIAGSHPEFLLSEFVDCYEILKLENISKWTVAHQLASWCSEEWCAEEWLNSKASHDVEILTLQSNSMGSVAYQLIKNKECLNNNAIFDKRVLTQVSFNKQLAHHLQEKYPFEQSATTESLIQTLVSQGAAYKHDGPLSVEVAPRIIEIANDLITQSNDPMLSLKFGLAAYSTAFHASNFPTFPNQSFHTKWQNTLSELESMVGRILKDNPVLWENLPSPDLFCEPSDTMLLHLVSKASLESSIQVENGAEANPVDEQSRFDLY
jgi:hypothetical protein